MRLSWWLLPWFAALGGCMSVLCGPTVYHLSGVSATTGFAAAWDAEVAEAGLLSLGIAPGGGTSCSLGGEGNGTRVEVNGCTPGHVTMNVAYALDPAIQGERAHVEEAGDAIIEARQPEVDAMVATFANATGWTITSPTSWGKGMLHGDC